MIKSVALGTCILLGTLRCIIVCHMIRNYFRCAKIHAASSGSKVVTAKPWHVLATNLFLQPGRQASDSTWHQDIHPCPENRCIALHRHFKISEGHGLLPRVSLMFVFTLGLMLFASCPSGPAAASTPTKSWVSVKAIDENNVSIA